MCLGTGPWVGLYANSATTASSIVASSTLSSTALLIGGSCLGGVSCLCCACYAYQNKWLEAPHQIAAPQEQHMSLNSPGEGLHERLLSRPRD